MSTILAVTIPFFALVIIGFAAAKKNIIDPAGILGINRFVYYFALPILLFGKMANAPIDQLISQSNFLLAHTLAGLAVFLVAWLLAGLVLRAERAERAIVALSSSYGNIGFMGIPLLVSVLGDWSAVPLALMLLIDIAFFIPLATVLIDLNKSQHGLGALLPSLVTSVLKNPLIISIVLGLLWAVSGFALAQPVHLLIDLLGAAAAPGAMFVLGAVLAGRPIGHGLGAAGLISTLKLAAHPAAMWMVMTLFDVSPEWRLAATMGAAMPVAASVFVIAQDYKTMPVRASTAVLVSTGLAMVSLSVLAWLLG